MALRIFALIFVAGSIAGCSGGGAGTAGQRPPIVGLPPPPAPSPAPSASVRPSALPSPTPTVLPDPAPSAVPTPSAAPTPTVRPTPIPFPVPSASASASPAVSPSPSPTAPGASPAPSPSPANSPSACAASPSPLASAQPATRRAAFVARDVATGRPYQFFPPRGARAVAALGAAPVDLSCEGGPVQTVPAVYLVFWGSHWSDTSPTGGDPNGMRTRVRAFAGVLGGSGWKATDTQYFDLADGSITNGARLVDGEFDDPADPPAVPQFADLAGEALKAATYFGDDSVNANYVILTPIGNKPAGFESQYCGYHSFTASGSAVVAFTNVPYIADGDSACGANTVNAGAAGLLDGVSIIFGHEQAETETDPQLDAWRDAADGMEIADKCAWFGLIDNPFAGGYPTQPLWSNATSSCVQSYP